MRNTLKTELIWETGQFLLKIMLSLKMVLFSFDTIFKMMPFGFNLGRWVLNPMSFSRYFTTVVCHEEMSFCICFSNQISKATSVAQALCESYNMCPIAQSTRQQQLCQFLTFFVLEKWLKTEWHNIKSCQPIGLKHKKIHPTGNQLTAWSCWTMSCKV